MPLFFSDIIIEICTKSIEIDNISNFYNYFSASSFNLFLNIVNI